MFSYPCIALYWLWLSGLIHDAWFATARVVIPNDFIKATRLLPNPFGIVKCDNMTRLPKRIQFWNYFSQSQTVLILFIDSIDVDNSYSEFLAHFSFDWEFIDTWQHLPLQLKFVLLLDFVQLFSHVDKIFSNLPFELDELLDVCCCCCCWYGHTTAAFDADDDGVAFDVGVVAVAVATVVQTSIGFVDSSSFNGSPFRLTTVISTSTPCNFDATDCNIAAHEIQKHNRLLIQHNALQSYYFYMGVREWGTLTSKIEHNWFGK